MITTEIIYSLLHELLYCLNTPTVACSVLKDKLPTMVSRQVDIIGKAVGQFRDEVRDLYSHPGERVSLDLPAEAVVQIHQLVSDWRRKYEVTLSDAVEQIREMRASGFKMEDPELDAVFCGPLLRGLERLRRFMDYLETIETMDLVHWNNERILKLLGLSDQV